VLKLKTYGLMTVVFLAASVLYVVTLYAGTTVPDEIEMKAAYEHKKSIPVFTHRKHVTDHKITCGECHHDDKGQPRELKEGDDVKSCFDCHNKPGELKGKKAKDLSKKEKLAYHANALHGNCIGCHRTYNQKNKTKAAPQKCTDCHPKNK
jgi:hypothetical protein